MVLYQTHHVIVITNVMDGFKRVNYKFAIFNGATRWLKGMVRAHERNTHLRRAHARTQTSMTLQRQPKNITILPVIKDMERTVKWTKNRCDNETTLPSAPSSRSRSTWGPPPESPSAPVSKCLFPSLLFVCLFVVWTFCVPACLNN